jgi:hypothetical protein
VHRRRGTNPGVVRVGAEVLGAGGTAGGARASGLAGMEQQRVQMLVALAVARAA